MTIEEFMKEIGEDGRFCRLKCEDRWLTWDIENQCWSVREDRPRRLPALLYRGIVLDTALDALDKGG